jgi:hypothetical protein
MEDTSMTYPRWANKNKMAETKEEKRKKKDKFEKEIKRKKK